MGAKDEDGGAKDEEVKEHLIFTMKLQIVFM